MSQSSPGESFFIVSRNGDPRTSRINVESAEKLREKHGQKTHHTYKTGGLNFYKMEAEDLHHTDRADHFLFSLSMEDALKHLPRLCKDFNFPKSEKHPEGLLHVTC